MDGERKYRQRGYQDSGYSGNGDRHHSQHPNGNGSRPHGPKPPLDITGPRLPRLIQSVAAARCFNCSVTLPPGTDFRGACPKCNATLHCCKQCVHFEPSTRFQCMKPIPLRIPQKDATNQCELFTPRVTVARDGITAPVAPPRAVDTSAAPRSASDARAQFENLFKK